MSFPSKIPTNSGGTHAGMSNMLNVVRNENAQLLAQLTHTQSQLEVVVQENVRLKTHNAMLHRKDGQLRSMDMNSGTDESTTSSASSNLSQRRSAAPSPASTTAFTMRSPGTSFSQSLNCSSNIWTPSGQRHQSSSRMAQQLDTLLTTRQSPVYPKRSSNAQDEVPRTRTPTVKKMKPFVKNQPNLPRESKMSPFVIPTIPPRNIAKSPVTVERQNTIVPQPHSAPTRREEAQSLRSQQSPTAMRKAQPPSDRFIMDTAPGPSTSETPPISKPERMTFRIPDIPPRKGSPAPPVTPQRQDTMIPLPRSAPTQRDERLPLRAQESPRSVRTVRSPAMRFTAPSPSRSSASPSPNALQFVVGDELPYRSMAPSPTITTKVIVPEPEHVLINKYLPIKEDAKPTQSINPPEAPSASPNSPNRPNSVSKQPRKRSSSTGAIPTSPLVEPLRLNLLKRRSRSKSPKKKKQTDHQSSSRMLSQFSNSRINFYTMSSSNHSSPASTEASDTPSTSALIHTTPSRPSDHRRTVIQQLASTSQVVDERPSAARSPPPTLTPVNMQESPDNAFSTPVDLSIRRGPWSLAASISRGTRIYRPFSPSPSSSVMEHTPTPASSIEANTENAGVATVDPTTAAKTSSDGNRGPFVPRNSNVIGPVIELE